MTARAFDAALNASTAATIEVTIENAPDTTPPVITVPPNASLEATVPTGAVFTYTASAVDAIDGNVAVGCTPVSGSTFPFGATTVACTATDSHANVSTSTFTVTVSDTTAPVITLPANATVEATGPTGAAFTYTASAVDAVDGSLVATCTPASGSTFPLGATTVSCTASDAHGNTRAASFSVIVVDTLAPSVTPPASITVAATEVNGACGNIPASTASQRVGAFLAGGTAVDLRDASPVRLIPQASLNARVIDASADTMFPVGTTNVVFRFRDASGNIGSAASAITVLPPVGGVVDTPNTPVAATNAENVPQAITASFATVTQPGLLTAEVMAAPAPPPAGFKFAGSVVDIATTALVAPPIEVCLDGVGVTAQDRVLHYEAGAWVDVPSLPEICATVASLSPFAVITAANHAPTANAGTPQTVEATSAAGTSVTLTGRGTDLDGDTLSFRWTERATEIGNAATVTAMFPIGSHLLTLTVSDGQLSSVSATFVTVRDKTAPAITVPANASVEATSPAGAVFTYTASAADVVDGTVVATCTPASGSFFPSGTTTVTCTARDARANVATKTFTVTVTDTTAPVLTVPPNATVEATGPTGAPFTYAASAADTLDGPVTPSCAPASGSTFALGATTVTCTASDAHGNTRTASFNVIVVDTLAPSVTPPAAITVAATEVNGARGNVPASAASERVGAFLAGGTAVDLRDAAPVRMVPQASVNAAVIDATADTL
ncbi:MAG: hypothetical protein DMG01_25675, partial [Acidobacteria bacterium]